MLNSQDDQGGPSRSSGGSVTPSRRPHRLPDNLNRELEMRKLGPGYSRLAKRFDWSQMIVIRRQNKSGKSSAESEGSPDEVLIFGQMRYLLIPFQQLDIWPLLKVGGSGRKKPGVLTDNLQRQRFELILLSSSLIHIIWPTPGLSPTPPRERKRSRRQISGRNERGSWKVQKTRASTISVHNACRIM